MYNARDYKRISIKERDYKIKFSPIFSQKDVKIICFKTIFEFLKVKYFKKFIFYFNVYHNVHIQNSLKSRNREAVEFLCKFFIFNKNLTICICIISHFSIFGFPLAIQHYFEYPYRERSGYVYSFPHTIFDGHGP